MNPVDTILFVPCAEPASDGLIVGEIFPGPRVDPSYHYIVHRSLTRSTDSLWDDTGEGLQGHVNDPCRRFHISTCHGYWRFCVNNCPRWCFDLNRFEATRVCWNRRISHTSYHVIDG